MKKKIYCVMREETRSEYLFVEAKSKEEAVEIADNNTDSEGWRSSQNYASEIVEAGLVKDENALIGRYIETLSGESYLFKNKT